MEDTNKDMDKTHGKKWSSAHYSGMDTQSETQIEVRTFDSPHATVRVAYGLTLNLGNYESARVDAGVELPCYPEEVTECFEHAWKIAQGEIQDQIETLRESKNG